MCPLALSPMTRATAGGPASPEKAPQLHRAPEEASSSQSETRNHPRETTTRTEREVEKQRQKLLSEFEHLNQFVDHEFDAGEG